MFSHIYLFLIQLHSHLMEMNLQRYHLLYFYFQNVQKPVDFNKLKELVSNNERRFQAGGTVMFQSNLDNVYNISDVMRYDSSQLALANKGAAYVIWESNSVPSAQAIRKLFPRPAYIPDSAEVSLMKRIYINGPLSGTIQMVGHDSYS